MLFALVLLAADSPFLRRQIRRLRSSLPGLSGWLERHKTRMPIGARAVIDATAPSAAE
jgi:hypothetical protein